jgi:hypothetical protein
VRGCPFCDGKKVDSSNCLATTHPELAKEWDYEKNSFSPNDVAAATNKKIWWICANNEQHRWCSSGGRRVFYAGCPFCTNQRVDSSNCLSTTHPELAKEWDYEKNLFTPEEITAGTTRKIWWKCVRYPHHSWLAAGNRRIADHGCPFCTVCVSKPETEWLESLGKPNDSEHRQVKIKIGKKWHNVDGFDPETNTVYEFLGDFWHGNPKCYSPDDINRCSKRSFGELYDKTKQKELILIGAGYKVVSIWESDWKKDFK